MSKLKITEEIAKKAVNSKVKNIVNSYTEKLPVDRGAYGIYINGVRVKMRGSGKTVWSTPGHASSALTSKIKGEVIEILEDTFNITRKESVVMYAKIIKKLKDDNVIGIRNLMYK